LKKQSKEREMKRENERRRTDDPRTKFERKCSIQGQNITQNQKQREKMRAPPKMKGCISRKVLFGACFVSTLFAEEDGAELEGAGDVVGAEGADMCGSRSR
jgi:hypothetical protein